MTVVFELFVTKHSFHNFPLSTCHLGTLSLFLCQSIITSLHPTTFQHLFGLKLVIYATFFVIKFRGKIKKDKNISHFGFGSTESMWFLTLLSLINLSGSRKFWAYDRAPREGVNLIQNSNKSVSEMNSNTKHEQHFSLFDNSETRTSFSLDASKSQEVITQFI